MKTFTADFDVRDGTVCAELSGELIRVGTTFDLWGAVRAVVVAVPDDYEGDFRVGDALTEDDIDITARFLSMAVDDAALDW